MSATRLFRAARVIAMLGVASALTLQVGGCGKEPPPPTPKPKPAPLPPPPPEPVDLERIRSSLDGIDARVQFPQEQAPTDASLAEAVFKFSSALANKDADALRPMLSLSGRQVLEQVEQLWWDQEIQGVWIVALVPGGGGMPRESEDVATGPFTPENLQAITESALEELGADIPPPMRQMMSGAMGESMAQMAQMLNTLPPDQVREIMRRQTVALAEMDDQQLQMFAAGLNLSPDEAREKLTKMGESQVRQIEEILASAEGEGGVETSDSSATIAMGVHDGLAAFVLLWEAQRFDDGWFFSPRPATNRTSQSLRDFDGMSITDFIPDVAAAPEPEIPDTPAQPPANPGGGDRGGSSTSGG